MAAQVGGGGVDEVPVAYCGVYHNPGDQRICVCAKDPAQCGKRVCAANLALPAGKAVCFIYVALLIGIPIIWIAVKEQWFEG